MEIYDDVIREAVGGDDIAAWELADFEQAAKNMTVPPVMWLWGLMCRPWWDALNLYDESRTGRRMNRPSVLPGAVIEMPEGKRRDELAAAWQRRLRTSVREILSEYRYWLYVQRDAHEALGWPPPEDSRADVGLVPSFAGKRFRFSGQFPQEPEFYVRLIKQAGGKGGAWEVGRGVDYVVAGDWAGRGVREALELGIPVVGKRQFLEALGAATGEALDMGRSSCGKNAVAVSSGCGWLRVVHGVLGVLWTAVCCVLKLLLSVFAFIFALLGGTKKRRKR